MAWQDIQTHVEKALTTIYHQQSPQPMDISAVLTGAKYQCGSQTNQRNYCWYKDETCKTRGKRGHVAKVCRSGNAQTPRHGSSKGTGKGSGKGSGKSKSKKRTHETCLCCGKEGHKKADCKFESATCSNCGKVVHLRAVCRNTKTREIEKNANETGPDVTVGAFWCMAVRDTFEDGHCDCIEKLHVS